MNSAPNGIGRDDDGRLRLEWRDGVQWIDHARLRRECPCSQCRAFRLRGTPPLVSDRVRVLEVHPQGYGVQLIFSDGHQRGIYPWAYLAAMGLQTGAPISAGQLRD
ncbi:DUF971 domain-containing protein [Pseudomonas sp. D8002]|uniref:DUF971 domain-containing protein n=1 Tax=Pseudomonas sp. D8002 TaxID=2738816 RepID=UPI0015A36334|nr:DUF971 domain-containing protein [Pseudomonas sp. D8002]NWA92907.1 DUF971 domain-containing protein [Pseudomonas sp. D8002]